MQHISGYKPRVLRHLLLQCNMKLDDLISRLDPADYEKLLSQVEEYKLALMRERASASFMEYVKQVWPGFVHGRHHAVMAKKFEDIASGKLKRLIINMPPRHTKSEFASYLLPSWFLGKYPGKKVIQTSNTAELAGGYVRPCYSDCSKQIWRIIASKHKPKML